MTADNYHFDEKAARVACNFFERLLTHVKGELAGQAFVLQPWQVKIIRDLFGWKRADGTRRYRTAYIEIPRKNGKSTLSAGIALALLYVDGEPGAEVYSAAADRDQASIVFDVAKAMIEAAPELQRRSKIYKRAILVPEAHSVYRVLSADVPTKHGLNAHGIVFDELHVQPNRELWDVLTTSTGSRKQPLVVAITTAGYDRESICWEVHEYARKVQEGIIQDDAFYPVVYAADEGDDWTDPAVWRKANPGLGVTVKEEYLYTECNRAKQTPAYQNTFRRLHLNQWTQQETRWLDLTDWDRCGSPVDWAALEGAVCYGGLDLASTSDLAAFVLDFPTDEGHIWLPFFWIPGDKMLERERKDRVSYSAWARDGLIQVTDGNVIDYGFIVEKINALGEIYDIREIAFDRWGAFQVSTQLAGAGFTMVQFGQGYVSMSAPTKELLRIVLDGKLRHASNPIMRWMADNIVVSQDPAGNVKPNKEKSREKIDGIVAGIMALDRAIRHENGRSVYETRGILTL